MNARVTISEGGITGDEATRYFRDTILPQVRSLAGFLGALDLVDPDTGDGITITLWGSAEEMKASEEAVKTIRDAVVADLGATVTGVRRYEVATSEILRPIDH